MTNFRKRKLVSNTPLDERYQLFIEDDNRFYYWKIVDISRNTVYLSSNVEYETSQKARLSAMEFWKSDTQPIEMKEDEDENS